MLTTPKSTQKEMQSVLGRRQGFACGEGVKRGLTAAGGGGGLALMEDVGWSGIRLFCIHSNLIGLIGTERCCFRGFNNWVAVMVGHEPLLQKCETQTAGPTYNSVISILLACPRDLSLPFNPFCSPVRSKQTSPGPARKNKSFCTRTLALDQTALRLTRTQKHTRCPVMTCLCDGC